MTTSLSDNVGAMVRAVVDHDLTKAEVARRFHTTAKTVAKWVSRFREAGVAGLHNRSSRPSHRQARLRWPPAMPSKPCAANAAPRTPSLPKPGSRRQPSAESSGAAV
jgi:transposase-like protein